MILYTKEELIILPIMLLSIILISIILYFVLRNKSDKQKNMPLAIISVLILILEVIKQYKGITTGYSNWMLPFHFCSLFLLYLPLSTLTKNETIKTFASTMSFVCCTLLVILLYLSPGVIIPESTKNLFFHTNDFFDFHTFVYHHLVVLYYFIALFLKQFKIPNNYYIHILIGISLYAAVAIPSAYFFNANFCNILFSNIQLFESIRLSTNQFIYNVLLFLVGLFALITTCFIYKLILMLSKKKEQQ